MNRLKQLSFLGLMFLSFSVTSQIYLGGQLNYNRYLGGTGIGFLGFGINGEKPIEDNAVRISLNIGLPHKQETSFPLNYSIGGSYAKDVNGEIKYGFININADFKFFLGDGDSETGGIYAFGGAGLSVATINYTIDPYDESMYTTMFTYDRELYFQPLIRAGAGYELELDFGNLFFEAYGNIPANSVNGAAVDINLPFSFGANAGIKIPIGG